MNYTTSSKERIKRLNALICSDGVLQTYKEGKIGVTVGCNGSRAYATLTDEEMIMGIPIELLADVASGLKEVCPY